MKLVKIAVAILLLICAGGFLYLGSADIDIPRQEVSQTIPNEQFFSTE